VFVILFYMESKVSIYVCTWGMVSYPNENRPLQRVTQYGDMALEESTLMLLSDLGHT
jgi:hypothetical protein